ncbi:MAG TPA: hypothetical protein V6D46_08460 [Coleofasciculaceae cyanobacterium]
MTVRHPATATELIYEQVTTDTRLNLAVKLAELEDLRLRLHDLREKMERDLKLMNANDPGDFLWDVFRGSQKIVQNFFKKLELFAL